MRATVEVPESMFFWLALLFLTSAYAEPIVLSGFDRVYVDVNTLELSPSIPDEAQAARLELTNPHSTRVTVQVDGVVLGELLPRAKATVFHVPAGDYTIVWALASGLRRTRTVHTQPAIPHAN